MSELRSFLDSLGQAEGEGEFTLDYQAALKQMRSYQLWGESNVLDCLVMSAVASGAFSVEFDESGRTLRHDGECPSLDRLEHLFTRLFSPDESLRYLAMAVNHLLGDGREVGVATPEGSLKFAESGVSRGGRGSDSGFVLTLPPVFSQEALPKIGPRVRYAPCAVSIEGRSLNRPGSSPQVPLSASVKYFHPGKEAITLWSPPASVAAPVGPRPPPA